MSSPTSNVVTPRVFVPSNTVDYGPYYADTVQRHPLGHYIDLDGGSRFRYVYVGTGGLQSEFFCCFAACKSLRYAAAPAQVAGAGVAGSRTVTFTVHTDDGPAAGLFVADSPYLIGGRIVIGNGGSQHPETRTITGNTATTSSGGSMTVTLNYPLTASVTAATTGIEANLNPYSYVTSGNVTQSGYVWFIGLPAVTCDAGVYTWVQTRGGPTWATSDNNTCNSAGDRRIFIQNNGSVISGDDITGDVSIQQCAGDAVDMSSSGASNAPFIMLHME